MIDHLTLTVADLERSKDFYRRALEPLGYELLAEFGSMIGFGASAPRLWLKVGGAPTPPQHIAFEAASRDLVDAFHEAALQAGGRDEGAPGLRPHYHAHYYAAFVTDPDGHPLEAVNHLPVRAAAKRAKSEPRSAKAGGAGKRAAPPAARAAPKGRANKRAAANLAKKAAKPAKRGTSRR